MITKKNQNPQFSTKSDNVCEENKKQTKTNIIIIAINRYIWLKINHCRTAYNSKIKRLLLTKLNSDIFLLFKYSEFMCGYHFLGLI